jgi:hypothetical protein
VPSWRRAPTDGFRGFGGECLSFATIMPDHKFGRLTRHETYARSCLRETRGGAETHDRRENKKGPFVVNKGSIVAALSNLGQRKALTFAHPREINGPLPSRAETA